MTAPRRAAPGQHLAASPLASITPPDVVAALVHGWCLGAIVPIALDKVEDDPLASAGQFRGDLLRALMEVPCGYWGRHPRHYDRYRAALRAGALRRRQLPVEQRMAFWEPLVVQSSDDGQRERDAAHATTRADRPRALGGR